MKYNIKKKIPFAFLILFVGVVGFLPPLIAVGSTNENNF